MAEAESYFDESDTHDINARLCVGGYVFFRDAADRQAERWTAMLDRWSLPYFHMVECAHHTGIYKHLSEGDCDLAAREAIGIIKDTASAGICVTVSNADYEQTVPKHRFFGSAYDATARDVLSGVSHWIETAQFQGKMHYFFEAGADTQNNASYCILRMMDDPDIRQDTCYSGHSFVPKAKSSGVQAADLLAWHAGQDCKRALKGMPVRKDFASLCEIPHHVLHVSRKMLEERASIIKSEIEASGLSAALVDEIDRLARQTPKQRRART